jgi:predicted DNA-binding WGR domain protein
LRTQLPDALKSFEAAAARERALVRLVRLERAAGVVEQPQAPRTNRRRQQKHSI